MNKEILSTRGAGSIMILVILCCAILMGLVTVKQDVWIVILLSALMFLPVILVYSRICALFPEQGLYQILRILFGKAIGSVLIFLFAGYALVLAGLSLRNFTEFTVVVALENTPRIVLMIVILFVALFLAHQGLSAFGKWSSIVCLVILLNAVLTILISLDVLEVSRIKPILEHSFSQIADNSASVGSIAVGETVLVLAIMGHVKQEKGSSKVFLWGFVVGIVFLTVTVLRNLMILGPEMISTSKYPGFVAARIIHLGAFFERMESVISFNLILMGIAKIALCLSVATMGAAELLKSQNYRRLLLPVSLLALALCLIVFKTTFEMFEFARVYQYLAFPIQVILPVIIWIMAEIKMRKKRMPQMDETSQ
ncbi:MAG: endospore germination permease [Oscillibacter sp.]|nr:endospore germination permease [Oscillibacter sp.]MEA4992473.1 endospore germination permease [Oscillibacter sp.]